MKVIDVETSKLIPYENNPRLNEDAVPYVAESIRTYGFKVPIIIDKHNVIVTGHTRWKAAQSLHMKTVPCIIADDLTDDQIKAFRLVDNKVSEYATWDFAKLEIELDNIDMDLSSFDFDVKLPKTQEEIEEEHEIHKEDTEFRKYNIQNLAYGWYEGVKPFDIPRIMPVKKLGKIKEWIGFNYVLSDTEPEGKAVHFFIDGYQFERVWNEPDKYIDKLKQYVCVASPDFSPYADMPVALQIYNHYRKHWVARYWQENGITVIPTIRPTATSADLSWWMDGEPEDGIIIVSAMWNDKNADVGDEADRAIEEVLKPRKIFVYGKPSNENVPTSAEVEYIPMFADKWKEE